MTGIFSATAHFDWEKFIPTFSSGNDKIFGYNSRDMVWAYPTYQAFNVSGSCSFSLSGGSEYRVIFSISNCEFGPNDSASVVGPWGTTSLYGDGYTPRYDHQWNASVGHGSYITYSISVVSGLGGDSSLYPLYFYRR